MAYTPINELPAPPEFMLNEALKAEVLHALLNPDIKMLYKRYCEANNIYFTEHGWRNGRGGGGAGRPDCLFVEKRAWADNGKRFKTFVPNFSHYEYNRANGWVHEKNGIEVLGMKPSVKTADGKFAYRGVSIADLKKKCKEAGVKGYSQKSKVELVKMLMAI